MAESEQSNLQEVVIKRQPLVAAGRGGAKGHLTHVDEGQI
jgi:hypothetical protein